MGLLEELTINLFNRYGFSNLEEPNELANQKPTDVPLVHFFLLS